MEPSAVGSGGAAPVASAEAPKAEKKRATETKKVTPPARGDSFPTSHGYGAVNMRVLFDERSGEEVDDLAERTMKNLIYAPLHKSYEKMLETQGHPLGTFMRARRSHLPTAAPLPTVARFFYADEDSGEWHVLPFLCRDSTKHNRAVVPVFRFDREGLNSRLIYVVYGNSSSEEDVALMYNVDERHGRALGLSIKCFFSKAVLSTEKLDYQFRYTLHRLCKLFGHSVKIATPAVLEKLVDESNDASDSTHTFKFGVSLLVVDGIDKQTKQRLQNDSTGQLFGWERESFPHGEAWNTLSLDSAFLKTRIVLADYIDACNDALSFTLHSGGVLLRVFRAMAMVKWPYRFSGDPPKPKKEGEARSKRPRETKKKTDDSNHSNSEDSEESELSDSGSDSGSESSEEDDSDELSSEEEEDEDDDEDPTPYKQKKNSAASAKKKASVEKGKKKAKVQKKQKLNESKACKNKVASQKLTGAPASAPVSAPKGAPKAPAVNEVHPVSVTPAAEAPPLNKKDGAPVLEPGDEDAKIQPAKDRREAVAERLVGVLDKLKRMDESVPITQKPRVDEKIAKVETALIEFVEEGRVEEYNLLLRSQTSLIGELAQVVAVLGSAEGPRGPDAAASRSMALTMGRLYEREQPDMKALTAFLTKWAAKTNEMMARRASVQLELNQQATAGLVIPTD